MTSLRGPDPYAAVERALAEPAERRALNGATVCDLLHETIPTYTWVAIVRHERSGVQIDCQSGQPRHTAAPSLPLSALLNMETTIIADVAAAPPWHALFPEARALIAVLAGPGRAIVVTSEHQGAFGPADRALLEQIGRQLSE